MPKSSQATGDVDNQRPIQPNLHHGSRGGAGTTSLTPEALRRHNKLAFLQQQVAAEDLANIAPLTLDPEENVDILRRSLLVSGVTLRGHSPRGTQARGRPCRSRGPRR